MHTRQDGKNWALSLLRQDYHNVRRLTKFVDGAAIFGHPTGFDLGILEAISEHGRRIGVITSKKPAIF